MNNEDAGKSGKKTAIEAERITGDNIYKVLICFDKLYKAMNDAERRRLVEALIASERGSVRTLFPPHHILE